MLLTTFLAKNYEWAQEPHLYCVLQKGQTLVHPAYRCGAAGTQLYKESDLPYRSGSSEKGLQGRMRQYQNYWLPQEARLFACLRTKKALVALPHQRTAGDAGAEYNVDRGNQTEVLARESHYHYFLDQAGLRWQKDRNNELFQPTRGPIQIVESLRRVQGLQLLLFDEDDWREDSSYTGGDTEPTIVRETTARKTPARATDQSLVIKMSKSGIEQLRAGNPTAYKRLMNLMREAFKEENPKTDERGKPADKAVTTEPAKTTPPGTLNNLFNGTPVQQAVAAREVLRAVPRQTRAQTRADQPIAHRTRARALAQA
tara:strand:- start:913 stop:1854 length:942 start_codon:yes stop_codon:yes gene_type:complete